MKKYEIHFNNGSIKIISAESIDNARFIAHKDYGFSAVAFVTEYDCTPIYK